MILLECIHKRMPTISQAERLKEEARRQKDVVMMFASDESVIRLIRAVGAASCLLASSPPNCTGQFTIHLLQ